MRLIFSLTLLALCACGGPSPTTLSFVGFGEHAGESLVVRVVEGTTEVLGTRQVAPIEEAGSAVFQFNLIAEARYKLQYFTDANQNGSWDGPLGDGEHSWIRDLILPRPLTNRGTIAVTIGHDFNHSAIPPGFKAP
jgi:hypothetical protein